MDFSFDAEVDFRFDAEVFTIRNVSHYAMGTDQATTIGNLQVDRSQQTGDLLPAARTLTRQSCKPRHFGGSQGRPMSDHEFAWTGLS